MRPPEYPVEPKDVPLGRLAKVAAAIGAVLVMVVAAMHGFHHAIYRPPAPAAWPRRQPPEPRLRVDNQADLRELRRREAELLGSYGWVDREKGAIRIPIERAMELTAGGSR